MDIRDPQTHAIIGASFEVHNRLGCGFLEPVYSAALSREFNHCEIPFEREVPLEIVYRGQPLDCTYRADFICYGEIIVELKAVDALAKIHTSQVINYLNATGIKRGLLLNFGTTSLEFKRLVN
jgi:GxxExxY protein